MLVYSRALDLGDMNAAANCFAEHGTLARPSTPGEIIHGREAIRTSLLIRPRTLLTKHLVTNLIIEVESLVRAVGVSSLTLIAATTGPEDKPPFLAPGPIYFGEFKDVFIVEDGSWKFGERRGSIHTKFAGVAAV